MADMLQTTSWNAFSWIKSLYHDLNFFEFCFQASNRQWPNISLHDGFVLKRRQASTLQWRHNGVWNHRRIDCLRNRLFRRRSEILSKLRVTGLCEGNSPVTGEFPAQRASNMENVSIWWRHHAITLVNQCWHIYNATWRHYTGHLLLGVPTCMFTVFFGNACVGMQSIFMITRCPSCSFKLLIWHTDMKHVTAGVRDFFKSFYKEDCPGDLKNILR